MRNKRSSADLYLYTFVGLLFGLVAAVDVGSLGQRGMSNQAIYIQESTRSLN